MNTQQQSELKVFPSQATRREKWTTKITWQRISITEAEIPTASLRRKSKLIRSA